MLRNTIRTKLFNGCANNWIMAGTLAVKSSSKKSRRRWYCPVAQKKTSSYTGR